MLPIAPGLPERRTHDYKRAGTTTLFAALEVATGKITADACYDRHRHKEFLAFLKQVAKAHPRVELHVVCDNYATHKTPEVTAWLANHHQAGDTARHVPLGPRADRRNPPLHRRLQHPCEAVRLDQDCRPGPGPRQAHTVLNNEPASGGLRG